MSARRWYVNFLATASGGIEVEAETSDEAYDEAVDKFAHPGLCHQCAVKVDLGSKYGITDEGPA